MGVDSRHLARLLAAQYLFTSLKKQRNNPDLQYYEPNSLANILEEKKFDNKLYESIIDGVIENEQAIDELIIQNAPTWPIDKINPVDLIILRIGIWEGIFYKKTPFKVIINEAIELAKSLNSKEGGSFVNGVLGNILKINEKE